MVTHRPLFSLLHSSFIHSVFWLTRDPLPLPRRVLHRVRSSASSFSFHYPLFSFRSSSICLHFIFLVFLSFISFLLFPSIRCFTRQFQRKMWTIQLFFLLLLFVGYFCLPRPLQHKFISYKIGLTDLVYPSGAHFKTSKEFLSFQKCKISAPFKVIIQM